MARVRPRVHFHTHLACAEAVERVGQSLNLKDCAVRGLSAPGRIELHADIHDVHLWSPQLVVDLEETESGCVLSGRFGPHPNVWTMYMAGYAACGFLCLLSASFAYAQWVMETPIWALAGIPLALLVAMGLYGLAFWGQLRGAEQMALLEKFLRDEISRHESLKPPA